MDNDAIRERLANIQRVKNMSFSVDSHHYIVLSYLYDWLENAAAHAARGILLDYGCGGQPYRDLFSSKIERYIAADIAAAADTTPDLTFLPGERLALPDHSVDTILSTQVLEHVPDHCFYLAECRRLMKPGSNLIITVPMQVASPRGTFRLSSFHAIWHFPMPYQTRLSYRGPATVRGSLRAFRPDLRESLG